MCNRHFEFLILNDLGKTYLVCTDPTFSASVVVRSEKTWRDTMERSTYIDSHLPMAVSSFGEVTLERSESYSTVSLVVAFDCGEHYMILTFDLSVLFVRLQRYNRLTSTGAPVAWYNRFPLLEFLS